MSRQAFFNFCALAAFVMTMIFLITSWRGGPKVNNTIAQLESDIDKLVAFEVEQHLQDSIFSETVNKVSTSMSIALFDMNRAVVYQAEQTGVDPDSIWHFVNTERDAHLARQEEARRLDSLARVAQKSEDHLLDSLRREIETLKTTKE